VAPVRFAGPEFYIQASDVNGGVINRSPNLGDVTLPLSPAGGRAVQSGRPWLETRPVENQRLLIYSIPLGVGGRFAGILQLGRSLAEQNAALRTLQEMLIAGSGIVTLIAFLAGWLLAGTALRPIHRITQTAQAIGAERDFGRRVEYSGPNDELGQLAATLNAMLTELQVAYQQTEEALQAQRRFVADASHELRTPLTTLRGNLALLQRDPPIREEDRVPVVQDMGDECERLIRLARGLLTLAHADAGQQLRREPVAVELLVEEVRRDMQILAPERATAGDSMRGVAVLGDRDALKQVLLILVDNALKVTPPDGSITVTAATDGEQVNISVHDTGPGIAPDVLPHIFERFYQGDAARTGAGTGLGLAIAKTLVEAQHGNISVETEVGDGSTFTISLPRAECAPETDTHAA
jgi:signal transduction histidine kinase